MTEREEALRAAANAIAEAITQLEEAEMRVPGALRKAAIEIEKAVSNSFNGNGHSGALFSK